MTVNIPPGRAGPATPPGSSCSPGPLAPPGPPGEACDADLIRRSEAEPEQFAALFRRHSGALHRYVARRLGSHVAEDIVAEVFLTAFRQRHRYQPSQPDARPWLYGIATNLIARQRRTEVRELKLRLAVGPPSTEEGHADRVADRVTAQALATRLDRALAALRPRERDILLLVAAEGLAYQEVAEALSVPLGTVKSRLNRARGRIRAELGAFDLVKETSGHG